MAPYTVKRPPLALPRLWEATKFVSWPPSCAKPLVRVPLPSGEYKSWSVDPRPDELATIDECRALRDRFGVQVWGERRWHDILSVPARSVARHRQQPTTPKTGVSPAYRNGRQVAWVAVWYEPEQTHPSFWRESPGKDKRLPRRRRSKWFGFGGPLAEYTSSEQAFAAAAEKRDAEAARWYCDAGDPSDDYELQPDTL